VFGREGGKNDVSDDAQTGDRPSNHGSAARSMPTGEEYCGERQKKAVQVLIRPGALANEGQGSFHASEVRCSREKAYLHLIGERSDGLRAERSSGVCEVKTRRRG